MATVHRTRVSLTTWAVPGLWPERILSGLAGSVSSRGAHTKEASCRSGLLWVRGGVPNRAVRVYALREGDGAKAGLGPWAVLARYRGGVGDVLA
ncbi:hypothetical protein SNA_10140 [Streptomyces natalensis ATCC 27448]|uniref:Uncharacterized protein n=1 Tax=Streptomyces natalensis ATCC 27448 TaxID=1240678 RepID=A0A0D7CQ82_9ACTN|nr:hypothetical protein SNA_10140 [Streptomyces natalensis ATCC 27448]